MTIHLNISAEVEARLRERATAIGEDVSAYAAQILENAVCRPSIDQVLAPLRKEFAESGTSDQQLVEQINEAHEEYHNQNRKTS